MASVKRSICSHFCYLAFAFLCALCGKCTAELPKELRVITYNIHHGEGTDGKIDLERIARLLKAESPHLVCLNEVDQGTKRTQGIDMPAELARLTEMKAVFEKNIDYEGGRYGNAVLSALPIRRHKNHKLPSHYEGEQRGLLEVELGGKEAAPGDTILFCATHLDYRPEDHERLASVKRIEEIVGDRKDEPIILAGDLNAEPDSRVLTAFKKNWQVANNKKAFTFPAAKPAKQIDFLLVRPAKAWKVLETRVLEEKVASDHRPVLAVLRRLP